MRFQHETYPEHTTQASRQVLLVSEFEIRDRLATSDINKFLYQYTSQAQPKQSHADMVNVSTNSFKIHHTLFCFALAFDKSSSY